MQRALITPESYFSEEPLFSQEGLLNTCGREKNNNLLNREFEWMFELFRKRCEESTRENYIIPPMTQLRPPVLATEEGPFAHLCNNLELSSVERLMLLVALEPHYQPVVLGDRIAAVKAEHPALLPAFAYYKDPFSNNYYPTLQSVLFLCAGKDPDNWREVEQVLLYQGRLLRDQIIVLLDPDEKSRMGMRLNKLVDLAPEFADYLLHGRKPRPDFGKGFPAKCVTTNLSREHLILSNTTEQEINDLIDWITHGKAAIARSQNVMNKSYPVLFYGPPGTGKSFAAKLIGKQCGRDVFRIDLSMIVSKYIGETEKNLAMLFDRAEGKDWILFFDEADALFGRRTGISDSKDKWANLEMSYLLQRMEEFEGLCILATNLKHNLDPAMTRRFQSLIYFPWPKPAERALIWEKSLPPGFQYADRISYEKLARYDFSGANIANVIKSCCVKAAKRGDYVLSIQDLARFIRMEYAKESRTP